MRFMIVLAASVATLAVAAAPASAGNKTNSSKTTSTPAPTSTPVPTGTTTNIQTSAGAGAEMLNATPLAATNSSLDPVTVSQTFPAYQTTINWEEPSSGGAQFYSNNARITSSVRYDAATQSYIIKETGSSTNWTFAPADRVYVGSDPRFEYYQKASGGTTSTLRLLKPGASNPLVQLTYASYGAWHQVTPGAGYKGATKVADTYFVYGIKTASADMPRVGTGTYNGVIDGTFVTKNGTYGLSGASNFVANFAASRINVTATPTGTPVTAGGSPISFGTITGAGSIYFSNSAFDFAGSNATYKMDGRGYFFGPTAQEIGAVFKLSGGGGNGTGVMVGKQ